MRVIRLNGLRFHTLPRTTFYSGAQTPQVPEMDPVPKCPRDRNLIAERHFLITHMKAEHPSPSAGHVQRVRDRSEQARFFHFYLLAV